MSHSEQNKSHTIHPHHTPTNRLSRILVSPRNHHHHHTVLLSLVPVAKDSALASRQRQPVPLLRITPRWPPLSLSLGDRRLVYKLAEGTSCPRSQLQRRSSSFRVSGIHADALLCNNDEARIGWQKDIVSRWSEFPRDAASSFFSTRVCVCVCL